MKEENVKAITVRAFKPKTTDSHRTTATPNLFGKVILEIQIIKNIRVS